MLRFYSTIQSTKIAVLVSIIILTSIAGCKRAITGPKPPSSDNEIEYSFNISNNTTQSYQPQIALHGDGNMHILWMDGGATEYEKKKYFCGTEKPVVVIYRSLQHNSI